MGEAATVPLTWAIATLLALVAVWIPVILSVLAQARAFGGMQAELTLILDEMTHQRAVRDRVAVSEGWIARLRDRYHLHANTLQAHENRVRDLELGASGDKRPNKPRA